MGGEAEEDLVPALEHTREMLRPDVAPGVILTDKADSTRNAAKHIFPAWVALLCTWHANKSISEHCKKLFPKHEEWDEFMKMWIAIAWSEAEELYTTAVNEFKARWYTAHLECVAYIESNWLIPKNRDKIVTCYTTRHLHLGNTTTCRAEGLHSTIKNDIESKAIDLLYAWDAIINLLGSLIVN